MIMQRTDDLRRKVTYTDGQYARTTNRAVFLSLPRKFYPLFIIQCIFGNVKSVYFIYLLLDALHSLIGQCDYLCALFQILGNALGYLGM